MRKKELEELRTGFDLVLDIDCHYLEYSKIAGDLLVKALKHNGIDSISCKFSGNKGVHIGVPFKAFPKIINNNETRLLFPDLPRRITMHLKSMIKEPLRNKIMEFENNDIQRIINNIGKKVEEITIKEKDESENTITKLNTESFLDIDTILISSRHLYRSVYSFNEKSGLISVPIDPEKILLFNKELAKPENVRISKFRFLDKSNAIESEAKNLVVRSYDFVDKAKDEESSKTFEGKHIELDSPLPEQYFPPCIELIFNGLEDGKKRSLFILVNFLTNLGWDYEKIEKRLKEWNKKNTEELRETLIVGHIRYHKQRRKKILPPNCENKDYYKDIGVCKPDNLCMKVKNPVNYSLRKVKYLKKV